MRTKYCAILVAWLLSVCHIAEGFNIGVRGTKCSLDPSTKNDPCPSLFEAICDGSHCKCRPGSHEDKALKRCVKGKATSKSSSSSDDFSDLPFEYNPDSNNKGGKDTPSSSTNQGSTLKNNQPGSFPALPPYSNQPSGNYPQQPNPKQPSSGYPAGPRRTHGQYPNQPSGGYPNQPQPGYPHPPGSYPNQPSGYPQQPSGYPQQPGGYPQQPGSSYPKQPGSSYPKQPSGYPAQPGGYPAQPGGYPAQPGGYPKQPGGYPAQPGNYPHQPGGTYPHKPGKHGRDPHIGEKTGGGIGGIVGLLIIGGLIYFCCCRGEKRKNFMSKLPFGNRGGAGGQMQMQATPGQQQTYMPTDPQYPVQQPVGAPPPPYSPTYQPTAPNPYPTAPNPY